MRPGCPCSARRAGGRTARDSPSASCAMLTQSVLTPA
jgi:hypothetical protein